MKTIKILFVPCLALMLTGCVSKKKYAELQGQYDKLKTEQQSLQNDYQEAKVSIAEYTSDRNSLAARLEEEKQRNKELQEAYKKLQGSYQENV